MKQEQFINLAEAAVLNAESAHLKKLKEALDKCPQHEVEQRIAALYAEVRRLKTKGVVDEEEEIIQLIERRKRGK